MITMQTNHSSLSYTFTSAYDQTLTESVIAEPVSTPLYESSVEIVKSVSCPIPKPSSRIVYTSYITNITSTDVTAVFTFHDTIPQPLIFDSSTGITVKRRTAAYVEEILTQVEKTVELTTHNYHMMYDTASRVLTIDFHTLKANDIVSVSISTYLPDEQQTLLEIKTITNESNISYSIDDLTFSSTSQPVSFDFAYSDLHTEKSSNAETMQCGDQLTYTITTTNLGNLQADRLTLIDTLPEHICLYNTVTHKAIEVPCSPETIKTQCLSVIKTGSSQVPAEQSLISNYDVTYTYDAQTQQYTLSLSNLFLDRCAPTDIATSYYFNQLIITMPCVILCD